MITHRSILAGLTIISLSACVTRTVYVTQPPPPDQTAYAPAPVTPPPTYQQQPAPVTPPPTYQEQPAPVTPPPVQPAAPVGYDQFYNQLAPYGQWVNYGNYGYVWIPAAGADFVPYSTAGHWEYTANGWMWVSEYQWGWAPFHYGRWEYDAFYGWFWIPGNEWAPAWVSWRNCNGYYGWAPLGYNCGWDCNYIPENRFVFVNAMYINDPYVYRHYEDHDRWHDYYQRSVVINRNYYDNDYRTTYCTGPEPVEVSRYTGSPVTPVPVAEVSKPGQGYNTNGGIEIYRPHVNKPVSNAPQPTPRTVVDIKQVQPVQQRTVMTQPTVVPRPHNTQATQPQRTEPVQQQRTEPVQQQTTQPQRTEPVQQQRTEPVQQQTTQPVQQQRTEPVQQQRTEPVQQQRTEPVQQQTTQPVQRNNPPPANNGGNKQPKPQKQPKPVKATPPPSSKQEDKK